MKERKNILLREGGLKLIAAVICGAALNIGLTRLMGVLNLPFYMDTVGTVVVAALGGFFPGILTGVLTNVISGLSNYMSIYYSLLNALIALCAAAFFRSGRPMKLANVFQLTVLITMIGGGAGGLITWLLYGPATEGVIFTIMEWLESTLGVSTFLSHEITTLALDFVDKAMSVALAMILLRLIPQSTKDEIDRFGWQQRPKPMGTKDKLRSGMEKGGRSMRTRVVAMLVASTALMALAVTWVSSNTFSEYLRNEELKTADAAATLAASEIDPDMVDDFIRYGEDAPGYKETEQRLTQIRESSPDIDYIYVYKIEKNGCRVVFDLDTENLQGDEPGELIDFDEDFLPLLPDLFAGKEIAPIESDGQYGWLMTVYKGVYDEKGNCKCYAAADISMKGMRSYEHDFMMRILLVFSGFFILILAFTLWIILYYMILPINSMAECARAFAFDDDDRLTDEKVKQITDLEISTGDEVENLYRAFCKMTVDSVEYMENIEEQARTIDEMQKGLIITMADMVEGRDSDTGDHVRKTAAYAAVILNGLKEKGYYTDQLSDKFISDVVQSAPLHDIGKINVSDVILNKPGRLTDEEFERMKTHTTAGREILEKTISTVHGESYLMEGRNLAAYHHEKWDGKGYPEGLVGEEIPLSARVMAVADVFDALVSKRIYKPAMPFDKAVSIIRGDAGTHFDPKVVEAFMDNLDEVKEILDYYNARESEEENKNEV